MLVKLVAVMCKHAAIELPNSNLIKTTLHVSNEQSAIKVNCKRNRIDNVVTSAFKLFWIEFTFAAQLPSIGRGYLRMRA
jgi:hypothetical protein